MKKTVRDAVEYFKGEWPSKCPGAELFYRDETGRWIFTVNHLSGFGWHLVCTRAQFEAEAEVWRREKNRAEFGTDYHPDDVSFKADREYWPDGLPTVGETCSMSLCFTEYDSVTITYIGDGVFCYRNNRDNEEYTGNMADVAFRPLSPKQKWLQSCERTIESMTGEPANSSHLAIIWDGGLGCLPED